MLRVGQVKLEPNHTENELLQKVAKQLRISEHEILKLEIRKQSIDARKKPDVKYIYTVDVTVKDESKVLRHQKGKDVSVVKDKPYCFPTPGTEKLQTRPVIIGSGPAGMFCAYMLAEHGYKPILFERGVSVEERLQDVQNFWNTGVLNTVSNVQFGEGGAGTFSDGKLNTLVKDSFGRNRKVLEIFVENGAPKEILYVNKPHIGTDVLVDVVRNMRNKIIKWGGEIHFHSCLSDFELENDALKSITINSEGVNQNLDAKIMILAIGHSARDTFSMLHQKKIAMEAKAFAVGVRVEHLQEMINQSQYGENYSPFLPVASYKVAANGKNQRGVYSFCMCPGGYVVNASSEQGHLAINGMSYHARDSKNANSAIIVTVSPSDYGNDHPLAGVSFQRTLEKKAYELGNGKIPIQRFEDFCRRQKSLAFGDITPCMKGAYEFANVRDIFPDEIGDTLEQGIKSFDKQIHGFSNNDTLISGVESRTSSPVRILRDENLQICNTGIYPCGEGVRYAGGITSAAMDGIKVAEKIAAKFAKIDAR